MGVPVREPVIVPWTVDYVPVVPASLDPLFVASYPVLSTPAARRLIHVYICFATGTTPAILRFFTLSTAVPLVVIISVRFVISFRFSDSSMVSSLLSE